MLTNRKPKIDEHVADGVVVAVAADVSARMTSTVHCILTRVGAFYLKISISCQSGSDTPLSTSVNLLSAISSQN